MKKMLIIGLTGGIGSGKTTVAQLFAEYGVPIIDADEIARDVTQPNTKAYNAIKNHFTDSIITATGALDRRALRHIIFENHHERIWLEQLLHPLILEEIVDRIQKLNASYCILVIPLLVEVKSYPFIDRILVVDASLENQKKRTMKRDNVHSKQIEAILNRQIDRTLRLKHADDIIENDGNIMHLAPQVEFLHHKYLEISKNST